ncbi:MAG: lipase family protein [Flavobacteriaceae bacterium]|nr:lipase family protein [Flavobacteriaceae bacterium]
MVLVPDYLGYGDSKHKNHSFEHKASLAQNGLDFIKASKEYLNIKKIKTDNKISLVGYSEGALASLAMHQLIEKNEEILINKSIAGEGLFLKNIWVKDLLLNNQDHGDLKYFLKLVESYKLIYPKLSNSWNYYLTDV